MGLHLPAHTLGICPSRDLTRGNLCKAVFPSGAQGLTCTLVCACNTTDTVEHTIRTQACPSQIYICRVQKTCAKTSEVFTEVCTCAYTDLHTAGCTVNVCKIVLWAHVTHANYNISVCTSHMNAPCTCAPHIYACHTPVHTTHVHISYMPAPQSSRPQRP